jgi:hypothetical protein
LGGIVVLEYTSLLPFHEKSSHHKPTGNQVCESLFVYKEECRSVFVGFQNRHEKAIYRRVVRSGGGGGGGSSGETSFALYCFQ